MARAPHPSDPALASLGLAVAAGALIGERLLPVGGLAGVATAAFVALLVGAPAAVAEWRTPDLVDDPEPPAVAWRGAVDAVALLVIAALGGQVLGGLGLAGVGGAVLLWALAASLGRWPIAAGALGLLTVAVGLGVGGAAMGSNPWTLLEPQWQAATLWGPEAVVVGLLLATCGLGQWTLGPRRRPGQGRAPWAAAGAGILVALALAVRHSGTWELTLGAGTADPLALVVAVGALASGAATVTARARGVPWRRALLGLIGTLWFAGPAAGALPFWWQGVVPLALAASLGVLAVRQRGAAAVAPGAGAVLALGAAAWGWPGFPGGLLDAGAAAGVLVAAFWVVATETVRPRRTA